MRFYHRRTKARENNEGKMGGAVKKLIFGLCPARPCRRGNKVVFWCLTGCAQKCQSTDEICKMQTPSKTRYIAGHFPQNREILKERFSQLRKTERNLVLLWPCTVELRFLVLLKTKHRGHPKKANHVRKSPGMTRCSLENAKLEQTHLRES